MDEHICGLSICHIRTDSGADFEQFCASVVAPAIGSHRPHLTGLWQILRPNTAPDPGAGKPSVAPYVLVFYGDAPDDDWQLPRLLEDAYGQPDAKRYMAQWDSFFATGQQDLSFADTITPL